MPNCSFNPLSKYRLWTRSAFAMHYRLVIINSFKHFTEPKIVPHVPMGIRLRLYWVFYCQERLFSQVIRWAWLFFGLISCWYIFYLILIAFAITRNIDSIEFGHCEHGTFCMQVYAELLCLVWNLEFGDFANRFSVVNKIENWKIYM